MMQKMKEGICSRDSSSSASCITDKERVHVTRKFQRTGLLIYNRHVPGLNSPPKQFVFIRAGSCLKKIIFLFFDTLR